MLNEKQIWLNKEKVNPNTGINEVLYQINKIFVYKLCEIIEKVLICLL